MHLVIASPHCDDAALSCCDHARSWVASGHRVDVLTLFSRYTGEDSNAHRFIRRFMKKAGLQSTAELEQVRWREDASAMEAMGVASTHAGFLDAGCRQPRNGRPFPLFVDELPSTELALVAEIADAIRDLARFDRLVAPLGIGNHRDHLIVRLACELATRERPEARSYYVDFPYALNRSSWRRQHLVEVLRSRVSLRWISSDKRRVLACYASQIPYLFAGRPHYPEIVLSRRCGSLREAPARRGSDE